MGILDTIKNLFAKKQSTREATIAVANVKTAAQNQNYNEASIRAFHALETIGKVFANLNREQHQTAREYAQKMSESGIVSQEELEPIILNFEIAKYSEEQVTFDDYSKAERALDTVISKFSKGAGKKPASKKSSKRRKPRAGGRTGASRTRTTEEGGTTRKRTRPRRKR